MTPNTPYDVVILGGGLGGLTTALRLQGAGLRTAVLEIHDKVGGCAGYYERDGFSFDVGATTLVDFRANGVGGQFLEEVGILPLEGELLPGYMAWLPDRTLVLHRDQRAWEAERLRAFGDTPNLRRFWRTMDDIAAAFWPASAKGIKLPIRNLADVRNALRCLTPSQLHLAAHLGESVGGLMRRCGLREDRALVGLLSMIVEDTLHSRSVDDAPLINAALGASIRGSIFRPKGGMKGFWRAMVERYVSLGGDLHLKTKVVRVSGRRGAFTVQTRRGEFIARQVVNTIPLPAFAGMCEPSLAVRLNRYLQGAYADFGSGIVVCLGVPEKQVCDHAHRHHQLLQSYAAPLGDGNNMFISVSAPGDLESAPAGYRAVMISTHTPVSSWVNLDREAYDRRKARSLSDLLRFAQRVYPELGQKVRVLDVGTPSAYSRFARRPDGAVGGVRLNMRNSNLHSMPHDLGAAGMHFAGEYTWPGLGTVAGVLCSRIVSANVLKAA